MHAPSSRSSSQPKNQRPIVTILLAVILIVAAAEGWLQWRKAQARREAAAQSEKTASTLKPGEDAQAALALGNYLTRLRAQIRDHEVAFQRMRQGALTWHIRDRVEIDRDRKIIQQFLDTNTRLTDTLQHGEGLIRAELETAKVPPSTRDAALALFAKNQAPILPLQMRLRQCDETIGKNGLAVLDLLDFNWGSWTRNEATQKLSFDSTISLALFQDYVGKIEAAANERKAAEDQLLDYQRRNPTR